MPPTREYEGVITRYNTTQSLNYDLLLTPGARPLKVVQFWTAWNRYRVAWSAFPEIWDPETQPGGPRWTTLRHRGLCACRTWVVASPDLCVHFLEALANDVADGTPAELQTGEQSALELLSSAWLDIQHWPPAGSRNQTARPHASHWSLFHKPLEVGGRGRKQAKPVMLWEHPEVTEQRRHREEAATYRGHEDSLLTPEEESWRAVVSPRAAEINRQIEEARRNRGAK